MRNEQVLTMEKVIHQSSKLKSNKIKLNAEKRVGKGNWGGGGKRAWIRTDTFIIYYVWNVSLKVWLHIICKVYLNEPEICLIRQRQLQCQTEN